MCPHWVKVSQEFQDPKCCKTLLKCAWKCSMAQICSVGLKEVFKLVIKFRNLTDLEEGVCFSSQ